MIAFLLAFGLTTLLIVGGMRASLRLRPPGMATKRRISSLRRSYAYTTTENSSASGDEMSRYTRMVFVISCLILIMLSVIVINAIGSVIR